MSDVAGRTAPAVGKIEQNADKRTTLADAETKRIPVRIEIMIEVPKNGTVFDAMDKVKSLIEKAREVGAVEGEIVLGRQRFPVT